METIHYRPKVDWWVYMALAILPVGSLLLVITDGLTAGALILGLGFLLLGFLVLTGVEYKIRDNKLGIRKFYHWTWIPIDKIASAEKMHGMYVEGPVSATLSLDRIRLILSDNSILRSTMPISVSPHNPDDFLARLSEINPRIIIKTQCK